jgi:hypothetical protein
MIQKAFTWSAQSSDNLRKTLNEELAAGWLIEPSSVLLIPEANGHYRTFFCVLYKPTPIPPDPIAEIKL